VLLAGFGSVAQDSYTSQRDSMVRQQIEARGVKNPDVLRVMRSIPRHEFVPAEARGMAYDDDPFKNVTVRTGDGFAGWPDRAPFDRIILTAAPVEIPQKLISQLALGGRLVAPVGPALNQELLLLTKDRNGNVSRRSVASVAFVPMQGSPR
jgi:protein-L-isoaspartate O-methyltransferase